MTPKPDSSYLNLIEDARKILFDATETPRIDAEILLLHVLQKPLAWLIANGNTTATAEQLKVYFRLVDERSRGYPIAYLIGYREFWTLKLKVTPDVLIPRPDTETLVEQALSLIDKSQSSLILDLGTGSGAIALAIAKECPQAEIVAVDSCNKALDLAKHNAQANHISNVTFTLSDWFQNIIPAKFDLILSNPPYIEKDDVHLSQGDLRFEPKSALVSGDSGLEDIKEIILQAPKFLNKNAHIIIEHGFNQAESVAEIFNNAGFDDVILSYDLNQLPRCTQAKWAIND